MTTLDLKKIPEAKVLSWAVSILEYGGMVVYPTETVYGLGVDATNQKAVDALLKFKGQRGLKPILIAVSDQKMAEDYVDLNDVARKLYRTFLPGPVAVVSKMQAAGPVARHPTPTSSRSDAAGARAGARLASPAARLAHGIASPDGTVGVRIPDYPLILKIIKAFGKPITSTSANISGARNPWSIEDIKKTSPENKLELIDLMLDAGKLSKRPPSTIVDTSRERTEIVREGEITIRLKGKGQRLKEEKYISHSPEETEKFAQHLIARLLPLSLSPYPSAFVLALQGPLGAGKTVFTKGIAQALGIKDSVRSPSYTLVREYSIPSSLIPHPLSFLYHIDAWRIHDSSEFQDLGLEQMLKPGNVIVIEWIERMESLLSSLQKNAKVVLVRIEVVDAGKRKITVL